MTRLKGVLHVDHLARKRQSEQPVGQWVNESMRFDAVWTVPVLGERCCAVRVCGNMR
jgi:hypothetical protein